MTRILDPHLQETKGLLRSLERHVDDMVSDALITIKDPTCGLGTDAERRDKHVNHLEKAIHEKVDVIVALYGPYANDHRFLMAVISIVPDLEHMGDYAKDICSLAPEIKNPVDSLTRLSQLAQRKTSEGFRALHQFDLNDISLADSIIALADSIVTSRAEGEALFDRAKNEIEQVGFDLGIRGLIRQILVAQDLKKIIDCTASIAGQLILYYLR